MPEYLTPGVYYELLDTAPPAIRGVRTDIAAFVGIAPRGPLHTPLRIESARQYQAVFGTFVSYGYLAYAVKGFFENGGQTCYVVRVAGADAAPASLPLKNAAGVDLVRLNARNPGTWGNGVLITLVTVNRARAVFTLAITGPDGDREVYRDLSLASRDPRNCADLLSKGDDRIPPSRWITADILAPDQTDVPDGPQSGLKNFSGYLTSGRDGLASLTRDDFLGTLDDAETGKRGLGSLERITDVGIVAMPDMHIVPVLPPVFSDPAPPPPRDPCLLCPGPAAALPATTGITADEMPPRFSERDVETMTRALIEHCEARGDRVAILDSPVRTFGSPYSLPEILDWRARFESERGFAALYYPWVKVVDPLKLAGSPVRSVPPSGHIAGLYARTDNEIGVHKAPANGECQWAEDVTAGIDAELQGVLNPEGVNCLRAFPARGIVVYGARTISSDADWRYVSVRRLLIMIEKAVELSTQWAVFEPHDQVLRQKLSQSISGFLESIWQRGMLAGDTPSEAFFVTCNDSNNPPESVNAGRIVTDVGVAPAIPAEFIVFRVGRTVEELETVER